MKPIGATIQCSDVYGVFRSVVNPIVPVEVAKTPDLFEIRLGGKIQFSKSPDFKDVLTSDPGIPDTVDLEYLELDKTWHWRVSLVSVIHAVAPFAIIEREAELASARVNADIEAFLASHGIVKPARVERPAPMPQGQWTPSKLRALERADLIRIILDASL